jgi:hypothetical protein
VIRQFAEVRPEWVAQMSLNAPIPAAWIALHRRPAPRDPTPDTHGGSTMKARLFTAAASLTALLAALGGTVYGR